MGTNSHPHLRSCGLGGTDRTPSSRSGCNLLRSQNKVMLEPQQEPKSPNLGSDPSFYIDLVSSCSEPLPGSRTTVVSKPDGESAVRVLRLNSMHSPPRHQPYPPRLPSRCPIFPKSSDASTITSPPLFSEFLLPQVLAHEQTKVGQVTERNGQRGVRMPWPRRGGTRG